MHKNNISRGVANLLRSQFNLNQWLKSNILGGTTPCDCSSVPEQDPTITISGTDTGALKDTEKAFDLSCIPVQNDGLRYVYIDVLTEDNSGGSGLSQTLRSNVFLTLCEVNDVEPNIIIILKSNGVELTKKYLIMPGDVAFLEISNGVPVRVSK